MQLHTIIRNNCCRVLITMGLYSICHPSYAASETNANFNLTEIAPGIYVHNGQQVSIDHPQHDDIANIGFIVGETCVAVIDTGGSIRAGQKLKEAIQAVTRLPVCYIINSHVHFDHLLGNAAFAEADVHFVGHRNLADEVNANRRFFLDNFGSDLGPDAKESSIIGPDMVVDDTLDLNLGNRRLTLTAHDTAHSYTDMSIYDHQTKTLWLSDLLFMQRIPALDGSLKGWLALLDKMTTIQVDRVVPGHGPVSAAWPDAARDEIRYLNTLLQDTRQLIAKGLTMEEIIGAAGPAEKSYWLLYDQQHKRNVSKAFTELEWE